jgi:hypothetical protein
MSADSPEIKGKVLLLYSVAEEPHMADPKILARILFVRRMERVHTNRRWKRYRARSYKRLCWWTDCDPSTLKLVIKGVR